MKKKVAVIIAIGFMCIGGILSAQPHTGCDTLFMQAVKSDNLNEVKVHLDHWHGNINVQDNTGKTGLMYAIENGNRQIIEAILDSDKSVFNPNIECARGMTALMYAVDKGNPVIMEILLRERYGIDVNFQTTGQRNSALHYAVEKRREDIVRLLLQNKTTQTTLVDNRGETAFMIAVRNGNRGMIRVFGASPGFDVSARPDRSALAEGIPPLLQAIDLSYPITVIEEILDIRGAMDSVDNRGQGAYEYWAASNYNRRDKQRLKDMLDAADNRDKLRRGY